MSNNGLDWMKEYLYNHDAPLLPFAKKIDGNTIAEDIIGFAADETYSHAVHRHKLEQRVKKINK